MAELALNNSHSLTHSLYAFIFLELGYSAKTFMLQIWHCEQVNFIRVL